MTFNEWYNELEKLKKKAQKLNKLSKKLHLMIAISSRVIKNKKIK